MSFLTESLHKLHQKPERCWWSLETSPVGRRWFPGAGSSLLEALEQTPHTPHELSLTGFIRMCLERVPPMAPAGRQTIRGSKGPGSTVLGGQSRAANNVAEVEFSGQQTRTILLLSVGRDFTHGLVWSSFRLCCLS